MSPQDVLTVEQIAEMLHITPNTIQRKSWREHTGCPLRKIGKRLYCNALDFQKWLRGK